MSVSTNLTAPQVKAKARELGADLVGIAPVDALDRNAPNPQLPRPTELLQGARSVIVLAKRLFWGGARTVQSNNRSAHFAQELVLTHLEEVAIDLVWFLEDEGGAPSLVVPAAVSRSAQADLERDGPLSLTHAAVEAGLGTLGLNLMLLTPEYGPRVVLGAVLTTAELQPDRRHEQALCLGESCGRCLLACPGDAIGQWELDVERCRPHSSPWGYQKVQEHFGKVFSASDREQQELARSPDTFMIWQSMLRGVGVYTGCTRCYDVCPVGQDYQQHLAEVLEHIPETGPEKVARLETMRQFSERGEPDPNRERSHRWIGERQD